jgi:hypothetical protein
MTPYCLASLGFLIKSFTKKLGTCFKIVIDDIKDNTFNLLTMIKDVDNQLEDYHHKRRVLL